MDDTNNTSACLQKTRFVFLITRLLSLPFWVMCYILPFLLCKDLQATPFQVTCAITLKPLVGLFAPYWSIWIYKRPDRLVRNLVWANVLKYLPFLLFPWMHNVWFFVFSLGFYMFLIRGTTPTWVEIMKSNIEGSTRENVFQLGSALEYAAAAVIPFFGLLLDHYDQSWRWVFFGAAIMGMMTTVFFFMIPIKVAANVEQSLPKFSWQSTDVFRPFKECWKLMREKSDFACFQVGFMLGGAGLMIMQPVFPYYFMDVLTLSYTSLLTALAVCKGIGFTLASPYCVKKFQKTNIFRFCSWVTCLAAVFPLFLICAQWNILWIYVAYVVYGMMQAGSELSWHMSGPFFAEREDSSIYTSTSVLTVGIRGCIAPLLGTQLYQATNSPTVLIAGCCLCLLATERMRAFSRRYRFAYQQSASMPNEG
ncbi:MAG: MFS transporter [Waddliaceae bacterium]